MFYLISVFVDKESAFYNPQDEFKNNFFFPPQLQLAKKDLCARPVKKKKHKINTKVYIPTLVYFCEQNIISEEIA